MKLTLIGLGKMGSQVGKKLLDAGHELVVDSFNMQTTQPMLELGAVNFKEHSELIAHFKDQQMVVWLLIPHEFVADEVDKLLHHVPKETIIVDAGNSDYRVTKRLAQKCAEKDVQLVDVGTSGGVWGIKQGFSMMIGGSRDAVDFIAPILDVLAEPAAAWHRFGNSGAGHFVKMVHNGVEYGTMQSFAEGYRILREGPFEDIDLGMVADIWQHKSINESFLNNLIEQMLKNDPSFDGVEGKVAESGEGRWTVETADELGIPAPAIKAALETRRGSQHGDIHWGTKFLAQLRNEFGGHPINIDKD